MKFLLRFFMIMIAVYLAVSEESECESFKKENEKLQSLLRYKSASISRLKNRFKDANTNCIIPTSTESALKTDLKVISRDGWKAKVAKHDLINLDHPISKVIIKNTGTETCETKAACTFRVQVLQTFHMKSKNWDDISYNFMVGGDGAVYEGRGWDKQGVHTQGHNPGSIGIAYIGTFNTQIPTTVQLNAGFALMSEGVKLGKLAADYKIYANRQTTPHGSPGYVFYDLIKSWTRWTCDTCQDI